MSALDGLLNSCNCGKCGPCAARAELAALRQLLFEAQSYIIGGPLVERLSEYGHFNKQRLVREIDSLLNDETT